jgi:thioredoxin 1
MATITITHDNIEATVAGNDIVILDFWASWCGPCKSFAPIFEAASEKYPDIVFGKVDTEAERDIAGYFEIRSIPTIMLFREQVMLFSQPGAMPAAGLDSVIEQARALDMAKVREEIATQDSGELQQAGSAKS